MLQKLTVQSLTYVPGPFHTTRTQVNVICTKQTSLGDRNSRQTIESVTETYFLIGFLLLIVSCDADSKIFLHTNPNFVHVFL